MPLRTVAPGGWLNELSSQMGLQKAEPLVQDVEQQRQATLSRAAEPVQPQMAPPSFLSQIPSLDSLLGRQSATPSPEAPTAPQGGYLASVGNLEDWLPKPASGTPAAMPSNAPQTGNINSSTITQGENGPALRPGESVGSVTMGGPRDGERSTLDYSNPDAFRQSLRNSAQVVADKYDLPAEIIAAIPIQESGFQGSRLGREGNNLFSIKGEGPAGSMSFTSGAAPEDLNTPFRRYNNASESFDDFGHLITTQPRYAQAVAIWKQTRDPAAFLRAVQEAGYATDWGDADGTGVPWWQKVVNISKDLPQASASQVQQQRTGPMPEDTPNGGRQTADLYPRQDLLNDPDKWSVCGPLGVMAFGAMTGHPVDYERAKAVATEAGWTPARGMAGPESQVAALRAIGVPTKTGAVDLATITREVRNGNPVGLSSPGETGHYFTVQGVDDQGRLDLGNSALSLRASGGTKRYWTLDELRSIGAIGNVTTAIYMDNPASPTPSVAADPRQSLNAGSPPAAPSPQAGPGDAPSPGAGPETLMMRQSTEPADDPGQNGGGPERDGRHFYPTRNIEPLGPAMKGVTVGPAYMRPGTRNQAVPGNVNEWTEPVDAGEGLYPQSGWPRNSAMPGEDSLIEETPQQIRNRKQEEYNSTLYDGLPRHPGQGYEGEALPGTNDPREYPWSSRGQGRPSDAPGPVNQDLSGRESMAPPPVLYDESGQPYVQTPQGSYQSPYAFQGAAGRYGGQGTMQQRAPLADEQPYNPDQGAHEWQPGGNSGSGDAPTGMGGPAVDSRDPSTAFPPDQGTSSGVNAASPQGTITAPSSYNDPTSGGTINAPINYPSNSATSVDQPDSGPTSGSPSNNIVLQDGRTTPPTPGGAWEPWPLSQQTAQSDNNGGQPAPVLQPAQISGPMPEDQGDGGRTPQQPYGPPLSEAGPEQPPDSPLKPLYDTAGAIIGYVKDAAQAAGSTIANEGIVRPIARPISNTIRAAQGREPLTPDTEPVPTVDRAVMETAHSLGSNVDATRTGYEQGNYGQAALGAVGVLGDLAPSTTMARQLNEMVPRLDTPLGEVGLGDAVMAAGLAHAAVTLGYGAIKAGGRTWSRIVQAVQEGVPAEKFGSWLDSVEGGRAAGVAEDVLAAERPRTVPTAEPASMSFADVSRAADSPEQAAARAAIQPEGRGMRDQQLREEFGRPIQEPEAQRVLGGPSTQLRSELDSPLPPQERVRPNQQDQISGPIEHQPQSISLNARPGVSAAAGLLGDVGNSLSGGMAGATAGYALPADSEEQRRQNALTGTGIGMVAGPAAGRLMPRAEGALATMGASPNKPVSSPSQSANPNIRNVARMMGGNYKPTGESRSVGEILSAALTDRWAIHANVPKEARARIKAVGGTAPAERLAERIEVNGPTIAHQRTVEEIGPALQSVGKDDEWLAQVLVHRHNLDIAKEKAQEVYDAAIAAGQSPARAQIRADRVRASRQFSGGMTEKDITQALVDVQTEIGPARFKRVTDAAQAFWDSGKQNLQRKLDDGIIDQATYDTLTQKYPHYVRTDIADYAEKGPANPSPGGKALGIGNNGIKPLSIEGTSKDRVNPILSTIDSIYGTESAITRNAAARDLVAVRDADPTLAGLFPEIAPDAKAYRASPTTMAPPDYTLRGGEEKLTHWDQGVARQFVVPKEYNQLLSPTPGALLGDNAGPLRAFYSLIRGQLTTHNPGLQYVTSPLRDLRDATIGMQTNAGAAAKRAGASLPENIAREAGGSVAALPEAVGRLVQAIPQVAEGFFSNTYGPRVAELRRAGMGFNPRPSPEYRGKLPRWLANPQDTRAAMEDLQRTGGLQVDGKADVARIIRNAMSLYAERVGNRIEMLPRVAAANMQRGRGGDMLSQVVTGQNATVSFLKGGWLTRQVNAVDPFLNTTVQSGAQNARLYRKSPAAFTAALITTVGIPALLAEAWNRSDPERAKAYEDRPEYLKNTGIIWELPGLPQGTGSLGEKMPNFIWEPLGNFGWAAMAAREAMGAADKATGLIPPTETAGNDRSDPMYWAKRGADILAMFSPVKGGDAGSAVASLLPPVASEAVDLAANRDFFRGSTIATDRADERASNLSKTAAGIGNALTGREDRPSQYEHMIAGPTGYAGQLARGASNIGRENDQTRPIQDVPGVGALASRVIRDSGGQRLQDERDVATASPAVRQALKDAGLRTDELVLPSSNIKDMPITRQEQAAAQRDFNRLLDQKVREALADPDWKTSSTFERERWLKNLATRARTEAGGNVVDTWDEPTYDLRTDRRVQKRTGS